MEVVSAIVTKLVKYTVEPVGQWLCYSFHYSSNIENMKSEEEELRAARERVQHSVDAAIRNGDEIQNDVIRWLTKVDALIEKVREVVEGEEVIKTRCSNRVCPNLKPRHQLSRKAKKIVQDIGQLLEKRRFEAVFHRPIAQGIVMTARNMDYVDLESRMSTVKKLMEALKDPNINVIGIWGMPGVGKTTLVREVVRQAKEVKLFDEVAMADVTESPNLRQIQGEIAAMLDLTLYAENVCGRAIHLRKRLTKDNKILVILDNIWEKLDLEAIGIPYKGCKVVLVSRQYELFREMDIQKDFVLNVLPEEEAWSLFEKMAGDSVNDPDLRGTVMNVAKECGGLPIALVTVSKALKNKSLYEWKDALLQLRRPAPDHLTRMQSTIYSSIKLSYTHLESQEVKNFFLLCARMDYSINYRDLLKYCYGLGLFNGISTLEEARNRLYSRLRYLKDSCLLLDCPVGSGHCHMHDVVRDVATLISSQDQNTFVMKDNGGLKEWPDADALKIFKAFSINCDGNVHELPEKMECPELRFLYVCNGDHSLQVADTFFQGMENLNVLDLTKMQLSSLPSSLLLLGNLQTLCLDHCELGDISVIGKLKNLKILSLMGSDISQLPRQIGSLTRLRLLDLSNCAKLEVIPPNVLSSLGDLEELYMGNTSVQWEAEGVGNERNNASLAELKHLDHLIVLEIHIRDASNLPKDLLFEKLERHTIFVGDVWDWSDKREISRTLKLKLNTSFQSEVGIKMLLKRTKDLYLDEIKGVKNVLRELDREGFQQLNHLHIQNNAEIKYIINSRMPAIAFPALETFLLKNMTALEEICHGQLPSTSFRNLRAVKLEHCDELKFVFSSSIARCLSQLQELEIRECSMMGAIVVKEEGEIADEDVIWFPQLRCLTLIHLPKLRSFSSTQKSFITDVGEIISEGKLDFYMLIIHEQVVFPNLEKLDLCSIGLKETQHNQYLATSSCTLTEMHAMSRFQNLLHLSVHRSDNMKHLLSFATARFMVQLKHLHIFECQLMEDVVREELGAIEEISGVLFPRLECLILRDLPILKRFCIGSNITFPSLEKIRINNCPKVQTFIFKSLSSGMTVSNDRKEMNAEERPRPVTQPLFNEEVAFPSLERLEISHMDDLKIIWQNQFAVHSICNNLKFIKVEFCENLTNIFPASVAKCLMQLEELRIHHCGVEEIVAGEGAEREARFVFPQVTLLYLEDLARLKWFYPGVHASEWPMLKDILVDGCQNIEILAYELSSFQETLQGNQFEISFKQPLFLIDEVAFPSLERLVIVQMDNLKIIWQNQFAVDSFCKVRFITVVRCENLTNIFPASLAKCLLQLEELQIADCGVEEIIGGEGGLEAIPKFVFPRMTLLYLTGLPRLKWFYPGVHASEWPILKDIWVKGCQNVEMFLSMPLGFQETRQENQLEISNKQALFLVDKATFPNLEELTVQHYHHTMIWRGQILEDCFSKLKVLQVSCNHNKSAVSPSNFLTRLRSLEKLVVHHTWWEEIFMCDELVGHQENASRILMQLRELKMYRLHKLKHLWKEDNQPCPIFHNLEILEVSECDKLNTLVPSSVAFQNLTNLEILNCHGLVNLITSSTARSLVQLNKMSVRECKRITEIVAREEGEANEVITFKKLTHLNLDSLPKFTNFCSGSYSFDFPSLEEVILRQCPEMKIFSYGFLSTPKLERVQTTNEGEWHWKDDLNTTIRWLWEDEEGNTAIHWLWECNL